MDVEKLFRSYPERKKELEILKFRISNVKGIDADEVIESMCFSNPQGERVQTSDPSDKTASVAINYRKVADRMEDEYFDSLLEMYQKKKEELDFFLFAISKLSGILPDVIEDMVVEGMSWEELSEKYRVSRTMIAKYRKKALREMEVFYSIRDHSETEMMLS